MHHHALEQELLQAFQLPSGMKPPVHLDEVDEVHLIPFGLWSIDEVHKNGLLHEGAFLFILDANQKLLLTYRSPQMVTCPNTWTPPGEHTRAYENPIETAQRGIEEEFGEVLFSKYVAQMISLTEKPLFYYRDYGSENSNRIDQQLTYLWYVQLSEPGEVIEESMTIDMENSKLMWLSLAEVAKWIDDKPADFCHQTIIDLIELGLNRLGEISTEKQAAFPMPTGASKKVRLREVDLYVSFAPMFLSFLLFWKACPFFYRLLCRQKRLTKST